MKSGFSSGMKTEFISSSPPPPLPRAGLWCFSHCSYCLQPSLSPHLMKHSCKSFLLACSGWECGKTAWSKKIWGKKKEEVEIKKGRKKKNITSLGISPWCLPLMSPKICYKFPETWENHWLAIIRFSQALHVRKELKQEMGEETCEVGLSRRGPGLFQMNQ